MIVTPDGFCDRGCLMRFFNLIGEKKPIKYVTWHYAARSLWPYIRRDAETKVMQDDALCKQHQHPLCVRWNKRKLLAEVLGQ